MAKKKAIKNKYYFCLETVADDTNYIKITSEQYNQLLQQKEAAYQQGKDFNDEYRVEKRVVEEKKEGYTDIETIYSFTGCVCFRLKRLIADEGKTFLSNK